MIYYFFSEFWRWNWLQSTKARKHRWFNTGNIRSFRETWWRGRIYQYQIYGPHIRELHAELDKPWFLKHWGEFKTIRIYCLKETDIFTQNWHFSLGSLWQYKRYPKGHNYVEHCHKNKPVLFNCWHIWPKSCFCFLVTHHHYSCTYGWNHLIVMWPHPVILWMSLYLKSWLWYYVLNIYVYTVL